MTQKNVSTRKLEILLYLKLKNYQVSFRLPTEQEWMLGARLKNIYE